MKLTRLQRDLAQPTPASASPTAHADREHNYHGPLGSGQTTRYNDPTGHDGNERSPRALDTSPGHQTLRLHCYSTLAQLRFMCSKQSCQHTRRLLPNQIRVHVLLSRTCNGNRLTTLPDTTSSNAVNRNKPPCPSSTASKRCIGQPIEWKELLKENAAHACIGCYVKGMDLVAIVRTDSSSASFLAAACNRKQTM